MIVAANPLAEMLTSTTPARRFPTDLYQPATPPRRPRERPYVAALLGPDDEVMAEINITPFTDVLLVLLIIFMILAALVTPPGFQKNLPDKSDNSPAATKKNDNIQVLRQRKRHDLHR